jgi:hypothetical protein
VIVNALVTPFEVTETASMLDLLWRSTFRWKIRPRRVTEDAAYGTTENIAAVERAGIRAYVPLSGAGRPVLSSVLQQGGVLLRDRRRPLPLPGQEDLAPPGEKQGKEADTLQGESHHVRGVRTETQVHGQQDRPPSAQLLHEAYVDRVRSYRGTFPY